MNSLCYCTEVPTQPGVIFNRQDTDCRKRCRNCREASLPRDVGTKAEDVDKYLESVLHLGKIWGYVVLLDEADVLLEQHSLEDIQRNALVSAFLCVLGYYEGIIILASNRVGTFDEAFKHRIQLALHYPVLVHTSAS